MHVCQARTFEAGFVVFMSFQCFVMHAMVLTDFPRRANRGEGCTVSCSRRCRPAICPGFPAQESPSNQSLDSTATPSTHRDLPLEVLFLK
ncbi:hypothetical protein AVEN_108992-1 [Araneus ventricosus]|uniref:Uncharacterized protein n=1 Tax=Araneus ventricosus TaxID=182803 RepID=A0A4Y2SK58_ARAVE|nr:hypothetical protein AVEN_108992-1 [Araneus ventricosus]